MEKTKLSDLIDYQVQVQTMPTTVRARCATVEAEAVSAEMEAELRRDARDTLRSKNLENMLRDCGESEGTINATKRRFAQERIKEWGIEIVRVDADGNEIPAPAPAPKANG